MVGHHASSFDKLKYATFDIDRVLSFVPHPLPSAVYFFILTLNF